MYNKQLLFNGFRYCLRKVKPLIAYIYKKVNPSIVEMIDGGICSQMRQYLIAKVFIDKGYNVEFDLSFFKKGVDLDGNQVRNFDLQKAFPNIEIKKVSSLKRLVYRYCFPYVGSFPIDDSEIWTNLVPPAIMIGYYGEPDWLYNEMRIVFDINPLILDAENLNVYNNIPDNSVAIHIRRGDLASFTNTNYGPPVSEEYILNSISYLYNRLHSPIFYFFSDGMDYVKDKILPKLDSNIKYQLVMNGSDKGYCDLFLISKCSHQITSKGALGKFGACLNPKSGIVIISKDDNQLGPLLHSNKEIVKI